MIKLYFKPESMPELQQIPMELRRAAYGKIGQSVFETSTVTIAMGLCLAPIIGGTIAIFTLTGNWNVPDIYMYSGVALWFLAGATVFAAVMNIAVRRQVGKVVVTLHEKGRFKKCIKCDYDLRGSQSPTCPECGAAAVLEID